MKKALKPLIIICLLIAIITSIWKIKEHYFSSPFFYLGTVEATTIDLSARISSPVSETPIREGEQVESGQTVLKLLCDDIKLSQEGAQKEFDRGDRLYSQKLISTESYDRLKNQFDLTNIKVSWCDIKSPIKGVLLNRYFEQGELVSSGSKLVTLSDLSELYAFIYVESPFLAQIHLNMPIDLYVAELGQKKISGKITQIQEEAQFIPKNVQTRDDRLRLVHGIKITFKNDDGLIKPGMSVEVKLPESKNKN